MQASTNPTHRAVIIGGGFAGLTAVADLHFTRLPGFPRWLAWLFIRLILIVEFQNRWAWTYLTRNRAARLITGRGYPCVEDVIDDDQ